MNIPVTGEIHLDELLDLLWRGVEDGVVVSDTGIVDENAGRTELFSDLDGSSIDSVRVGDVAFDVERGHWSSVKLPRARLRDFRAYSPVSSRSGKGDTSMMTTLTPLFANALTISSPIPEHPPVTTAISSFQFHR